jgi:hypothetical protein
MSAIILEILKKNPEKIFTQTEIIDEIEKETGKRKSKSAVSQNIKTLSNKNQINYEKGLGRNPAKISLKIIDSEKPKPKPIIEPKPKPIIEPKPKPIIEPKPKPIDVQLSKAEKELANGIEEFTKEDLFNKSITEKIEETSNLIDIQLLKEANESLTIAKETVINQNEEIQRLELEIAFVKGINKRPFTFKEFSDYMLSQSKRSGSNSMRLGEIAYRLTSLKNIYLIILHLRDVNKL